MKIYFKCINKGYSGFYIEEHYTSIIDQLIDLIVGSNYDIEVNRNDKNVYTIMILVKLSIMILELNVIKLKIKII